MKRHPGPVRVGDALAELHGELGTRGPAAGDAADAFLARHKRFAKGPGPGYARERLIRAPHARRFGPKVGFVPWWVSGRITQETILLWLKFGTRSDDRYEREIVRRLVAAYTRPDGGIDERRRRALMPIASLGFLLWKLSLSSIQPGYIGFVQGHARGMLAKLSPAWNGGFEAFHPDTIGRHIGILVGLLEGLLERWQPPPDEAVGRGLPHSTWYVGDGRELHQALNIYRWKDVPELRDPSRDAGVGGWQGRALAGAVGVDVYTRGNLKNAGSGGAAGSPFRPDPGSAYSPGQEIKTSDRDLASATPEDRGARFGEPRRDSNVTDSNTVPSSPPPIGDATGFEGVVPTTGEERAEMHAEALPRAPLAAQPTRRDQMTQAELEARLEELERRCAAGDFVASQELTELCFQQFGIRGGTGR